VRNRLYKVSDTPVALQPPFARSGDSKVVLHHGGMALLDAEGRRVSANGDIELRLVPSPQVVLTAEPEEDIVLPGSEWRLELDGASAALLLVRSRHDSRGSRVEAVLTAPFERNITTATNATEVRFELINFIDVFGSPVRLRTGERRGRLSCTAGDFQLTLDPVPTYADARRRLEEGDGFSVTHVASLRRLTGDPISREDYDAVSRRLFRILSFAAGSYVGLGCAVGLDDDQNRCWEIWTAGRVHRWGNRMPWLPALQPQYFQSFVPKCWALFDQRGWASAMPHAVGSLVEGMRDGSIETRLATLVTGLEIVSWTILVVERELLDDQEFDRLRLEGALNLALGLAGIPRGVPAALTELRAFASKSKEGSAPRSLIVVRNRVVHPPTKQRERPSPPVLIDAWRLALWYLELLILHRSGYEGDHLTPWADSVWEKESVPWM
jgi:hypothetical protein